MTNLGRRGGGQGSYIVTAKRDQAHERIVKRGLYISGLAIYGEPLDAGFPQKPLSHKLNHTFVAISITP